MKIRGKSSNIILHVYIASDDFNYYSKESFSFKIHSAQLSRPIKDFITLIIIGINQVQNNKEIKERVTNLTKLYSVRKHRFLDIEKTIRQEGIKDKDTIIITDTEESLVEGYIFANNIPPKRKSEDSRSKLVISGIIKGIPWIGNGLDALIFGKK